MEEQIFLLRRWRERDKEEWKWSLKDIKEGRTEFFVSGERLIKFLTSMPEDLTIGNMEGKDED